MPLVVFVVCVLLNPNFWQGFSNSKYIDELLNEELDDDEDDDDDYLPEITRKTTKRGRKYVN